MIESSLDCRTTLNLLGRWYDHDLPFDEAAAFEEHLVACPPCRVENQRLRVALRSLRAAAQAPEAEPVRPPALEPAAAPDDGRYWKFLRTGGTSPIAAFGWASANGDWVVAAAIPCRSGVHACRTEDLPYWLDEELWAIELQGVQAGRHKVVAARGRLTHRVDGWTPAVARELSRACLERTAGHAAQELRNADLDDEC